MPTSDESASGSYSLQLRDWFDQRRGEGSFDELMHASSPDWPERISPLAWCPLRPMLDAVEQAISPDEDVEVVLETIAANSAKIDLETSHKAYLWVPKPEDFIKMSDKMWSGYANFGSLAIVHNEPGYARLELSEVPPDLLDWSCASIRGYTPVGVEKLGGKNTSITVEDQRSAGDRATVVFEYRYDSPEELS